MTEMIRCTLTLALSPLGRGNKTISFDKLRMNGFGFIAG